MSESYSRVSVVQTPPLSNLFVEDFLKIVDFINSTPMIIEELNRNSQEIDELPKHIHNKYLTEDK